MKLSNIILIFDIFNVLWLLSGPLQFGLSLFRLLKHVRSWRALYKLFLTFLLRSENRELVSSELLPFEDPEVRRYVDTIEKEMARRVIVLLVCSIVVPRLFFFVRRTSLIPPPGSMSDSNRILPYTVSGTKSWRTR